MLCNTQYDRLSQQQLGFLLTLIIELVRYVMLQSGAETVLPAAVVLFLIQAIFCILYTH